MCVCVRMRVEEMAVVRGSGWGRTGWGKSQQCDKEMEAENIGIK